MIYKVEITHGFLKILKGFENILIIGWTAFAVGYKIYIN